MRKTVGSTLSLVVMAGLVVVVIAALVIGNPADDSTAGSGKSGSKEWRAVMKNKPDSAYKQISDKEWRKLLTPEQYRVLREKGTERAFTGKYWNTKKEGVYLCAACGQELFSSETKYESGSGWPSFWNPLDSEKVATETDSSLGMVRSEIVCGRCGSHLGHVFDDGPNPTGLRYCVNSAALKLEPAKNKNQDNNDSTKSEDPDSTR